MRPVLPAAIVLVLGLAKLHSGAPLPETMTDPRSFDDLFAVAFTRAFVDPKDLADIQLLGDGPEIVVRSDIPNSPFRIGAGALPVVHGKKFLLLSADQIRARAAWQGDVFFVAVDELKVAGDDAEFYIGVEVTTSPQRAVLCCCSNRVQYSRIDGAWIYRGSNVFRCS